MAKRKRTCLSLSFCFANYNLQRAFSRPKQYMVIAVMTVHILWISSWIRDWLRLAGETYSTKAFDYSSINFMEFFIIMSNHCEYYIYMIIGLMFLFSDCPFDVPGTGYYLFRSDRSSWFWGQVIYIVILVFLFNLFLALLCSVALVPHVTLNNEWSANIARGYEIFGNDPKYMTAFPVDDGQALSRLTQYMSPMMMGMVTFAFNTLWMSALGCFTLALSLYTKSKLGFIAVGVWITLYRVTGFMNYTFMNLLLPVDFVYLSKFIVRWYDGRWDDDFSKYIISLSEKYAVGFFVVVLALSCAFGLYWAKKYDFSRSEDC